ncbi:hypothetical protein D3C85_1705370 [compost metagenome]
MIGTGSAVMTGAEEENTVSDTFPRLIRAILVLACTLSVLLVSVVQVWPDTNASPLPELMLISIGEGSALV